MKMLKAIYNNCGWFFLALLVSNVIMNFLAPNSLIGSESIKSICLFLKIKMIFAIVLAIFMVLFISKLSIEKCNQKGYGIGHKIVSMAFSCFVSLVWLNHISVQSQYSAYGIINLFENIYVLQKIDNGDMPTQKLDLTKFDDDISVFIRSTEKSSYPSGFQGVQAAQLYNFYGICADSDKVKEYKNHTYAKLTLYISKNEYEYYKKLLGKAKNNDEFIIEFYVDENGKSLGYIESIQYVEKEYLSSYSIKVSMHENSDVYVFTRNNDAEFDNMNWLLIKDGEIKKIADADKIAEFRLLKDASKGIYTVLLCIDYNSNTGEYTQISNAIEIVI